MLNELKAEIIMSSLIQNEISRKVLMMNLTLMGTGQFGHSVIAVINGMIIGIIENSEDFLKQTC